MEVRIIHNKKQLADLINQLQEHRLPLKIAIQDVYPIRTLESNSYLWGIVYETIARATGQTAIEVHEGYKVKYNFRYNLKYNKQNNTYVWVMEAGSTTGMDMREIWEYIMKVRADAEVELNIIIQMPNESFINELDFEHDTIQSKRL